MRAGILGEIWHMAVDSLKTHKMRSFLTMLGIVIGVMTVVGMVSVIQGLNRSFLRELESVGSDLIIVAKFEPGAPFSRRSEEERQRKDLTFDDALALKSESPLIKAVAVQLLVNVFETIPIKHQNIKSEESLILGFNDQYPQVLSVYEPQRGRFLSEPDVRHSAKVCVLGFDLAETLFPHSNALGKEIRIGAEAFEVVGVLQKRGMMFGRSQDNFAGIPITTLMKYFPYDLEQLQIIATPRTHGYMSETIEDITNILRRRRKVGFGKPNDFSVFTQDTMIGLYNQITGAVFLVMAVISSIGLLVGGIGVMNIMLVSVKERTREIGIRKAIGARSADILKQFLFEAVLLTGTGGILGIVFGFLISLLVKAATPLPASVTPWSVALGFLVSVSVGLFFGIFPARRAARLDPVVSLRYE
ncbi:MAG: efflux pump, inner rane subunit [Candidatus Aminicenantes bacterium]|nr:efflux pump, inner rane subunit [Candidatus Aminicenantes bacterium]